jgi:hypothetical protein
MLITEGSIIKLVGPFFLAIYIRMPTINYSVTQSIDTLAVNLSASEALVMNINNPLIGASYFGLETIPDNNGVYTSASPKNTSGSFTLGTGVLGVVKDDYKMGAVVSPGSNVLTFVPAQAVTGSTLRTRGIAAPPPSTGFDADAEAFFARVTAAGGALSSTEQTAVNQLVLDMKSAGIWSAMKAVYPMVGASAAACAQNLKSSSFTGTFTSGWTFASTGVTPNGTSAYMDTTFNPNTSISDINSAHLSIYSRTTTGNSAVDIGAANPYWDVEIIYSGQYFVGPMNNSYLSTANSDAKGLWTNSRISSSDIVAYRNGSSFISGSSAPTTKPPYNVYIGARNDNTVPLFFSNRQYAFASIGDGLTSTNVSNLYTAVQAFQTTLSRQV